MINRISGVGAFVRGLNLETVQQRREQMFNRVDRNSDGGLDRTEMQMFADKLSERTGTSIDIDDVFAKFDGDHDGVLGKAEGLSALTQIREETKGSMPGIRGPVPGIRGPRPEMSGPGPGVRGPEPGDRGPVPGIDSRGPSGPSRGGPSPGDTGPTSPSAKTACSSNAMASLLLSMLAASSEEDEGYTAVDILA